MPLDIRFTATRPEECSRRTGMSPYVPTLGHVASAWDLYRSAAVYSDDGRLVNACITDIETVEGFNRVVFGTVRTYRDFEACELALQALLFHEYIEIIVPTIKVEYAFANAKGNSATTISYLRPDKFVRSDGCFNLFGLADTADFLCATDYAYALDRIVIQQSRSIQSLEGQSVDSLEQSLGPLNAAIANVSTSVAMDLKVPGYFIGADQPLGTHDSFFSAFYSRVAISLQEHVKSAPGLGYSVRIPPLLAVVLDRAATRAALPRAITELRGELDRVRAELCEFDEMIRSNESQTALERKCVHIHESFAAVVPESRLELGARMLARTWSLIKPIRSAYNIAVNPVALSPSQLEKLASDVKAAVIENASLVDRTVTAATFSRLLRAANFRALIARHFSDREMSALTADQGK